MLRLYALYELNKRLLAFMITLFITTLTSAATIHILALSQSRSTSHDIPTAPFCVPHGLPSFYWVVWVPILVFEATMLILAIRRATRDGFTEEAQRSPISPATLSSRSNSRRYWGWRDHAQSPWMQTKRFAGLFMGAQRMIDILIRDSVLFFLV
jgi:hypothetical protein